MRVTEIPDEVGVSVSSILENSPELRRAESLIRSIPDHPKPGVLFRDITPLLADAAALRATAEALVAPSPAASTWSRELRPGGSCSRAPRPSYPVPG